MVLYGIPTALFRIIGYRLEKDEYPPDYSEFEIATILETKSLTMLPHERIVSLIRSIDYIVKNNIPGDIVECGVWRGGSMLSVAIALNKNGDLSRDLYLYDTFEYFKDIATSDNDIDYKGASGNEELKNLNSQPYFTTDVSKDDVIGTIISSGYPIRKIVCVKGKVEVTIPGTVPGKIALLRLDTDMYSSTKHELEHLYPLLSDNGVLIIDDYGHWGGVKQAVDEYFKTNNIHIFMHRDDYSCRTIIKRDR